MYISITPRKETDRGGYICMPLAANCPTGHKDWKMRKCPECGAICWEMPGAKKLEREQGAKLLCTMCALKMGVKVR